MATAATTTSQNDADLARLHEILESFDDAILMTKRTDGTDHLHGRPMRVQAVEADHSVWFFTSLDSSMVHEAMFDTEAYVVGQAKNRHAVVRGFVSTTKDRARIDRYWNKHVEAWFPEGRSDPNLCLMKFTPREGEWWDDAGVRGVQYVASTAKAVLTGTQPRTGKDMHGKTVV
jgi:general stress protein 26